MKNVIEILRARGFIEAVTNESITEALVKPQKIYIGFDPTAESLHLGNLVGIIMLAWFKKCGHTPVGLVGGATGRIGDPSGRSQERSFLSDDELKRNIAAIDAQLNKLLGRGVEVLNNDSWLSKMPMTTFLRDVGKHFRLGPMLGKDSVRTRLESDEGMSYTEFSYQLLQGYDFYHLAEHEGITIQGGGSDQWGNITAGIEYTRRMSDHQLYGITFPLLTRSDGKKFGKSEGGAIWLDAKHCSPYKFYQYLIQVADADVCKLLRMLTFVEIEKIEAIEKSLADGVAVPNAAQRLLADEVTRFVHGEKGVAIAHKVTEAAKPGAQTVLDLDVLEEIAADMPSADLSIVDIDGKTFAEIAVASGLLKSKGEGNRLVQGGGAYLNNQKVNDANSVFKSSDLIGGKYLIVGSGKKKKLLVKIK
ncbi:MAG: tyrosine--tRNA ligase [Simkaniaceae bacterium]|nr:tyrosine--tRNA ligase [Simkaniaceae bacterium]